MIKKICRPTASFKEGWAVLTGTIVLALYYVTFQCGRKNIFRFFLKISFAHKKLKNPPQKFQTWERFRESFFPFSKKL